jgi:rod shape-determining protein MreC
MRAFEPDHGDGRDGGGLAAPLFFLGLSLVLLVLPVEAQREVSKALRSSALAPFLQTQETIARIRLRGDEVERLEALLDRATATLVAQATVEEENRRLRLLLGVRERLLPGLVSASATWPDTRGSESVFLLDVGTADGVSVNDPVIVADGLVGVVREVWEETALVMDWTDPDFRVSAMTESGTAFGLVSPIQGGFMEKDRLLLDAVPYYAPVEPGMRLVTDGRGGVYPRGIQVGIVSGLAEADAGWRKSFWVEPAALPGTATHVLVLVSPELWTPESGGEEAGEGQ